MAEAWPVDVNQDVMRDTVTSEPEDGAFRFKPDVGPSVDHSRTIIVGEVINFQQWFTLAEYMALSEWRRTTLKNGVLPFTRLHPIEQVEGTFKFMEGGFKMVALLPLYKRVAFIIYRLA